MGNVSAVAATTDFNHDGWLDICMANITTAEFLQEANLLWHNNGIGPDGNLTFTDIAMETGTYDGGWGCVAKFFDPDGDLDIIAVMMMDIIGCSLIRGPNTSHPSDPGIIKSSWGRS